MIHFPTKLDYDLKHLDGVLVRSNNPDARAILLLVARVLEYTKELEARLAMLEEKVL